jgi:hypothetical protein
MWHASHWYGPYDHRIGRPINSSPIKSSAIQSCAMQSVSFFKHLDLQSRLQPTREHFLEMSLGWGWGRRRGAAPRARTTLANMRPGFEHLALSLASKDARKAEVRVADHANVIEQSLDTTDCGLRSRAYHAMIWATAWQVPGKIRTSHS